MCSEGHRAQSSFLPEKVNGLEEMGRKHGGGTVIRKKGGGGLCTFLLPHSLKYIKEQEKRDKEFQLH